jgi:hypothetical protein
MVTGHGCIPSMIVVSFIVDVWLPMLERQGLTMKKCGQHGTGGWRVCACYLPVLDLRYACLR